MVAVALALTGCGTAELDVERTFDDTWDVTDLVAEGEIINLVDQQIEIEIDTGQSAIRGRTNCQRLFGSYTLVDNGASSGEASFTIPSPAASSECRPVDQLVHTQLIEALESVTQWAREGSTLTLTSPSETRLVLLSQAG